MLCPGCAKFGNVGDEEVVVPNSTEFVLGGVCTPLEHLLRFGEVQPGYDSASPSIPPVDGILVVEASATGMH